MAIINTPFLKRNSFDQEKLTMFIKDHKLKNEGEVAEYIRRRVRHALASALFFGSQFGVNRYWIKQSDHDRHVERVHDEYVHGLAEYNKRVSKLEVQLKNAGPLYNDYRKELADFKIDYNSLSSKQLKEKISKLMAKFPELSSQKHLSEKDAEAHHQAWREVAEKELKNSNALTAEEANVLVLMERYIICGSWLRYVSTVQLITIRL